MHLYKTRNGNLLVHEGSYFLLEENWDSLINREGLYSYLLRQANRAHKPMSPTDAQGSMAIGLLPPIGTQEVWAAGVTYLRSRDARIEESKESGGADCYQKVYEAERPELFFKSLAHRVAGHN